jgi:UPF0755 protein
LNTESNIFVDIPIGSGTSHIAKTLYDNKLIKHPLLFRLMSKMRGYDGTYKVGVHALNSNLKYDQIMKSLTNEPDHIKIVVPAGQTFNQIAQDLYFKGLISDKKKFTSIAKNDKYDYKFIKSYNKASSVPLEGYLLPDTYIFDIKASERDIIKTMLDRFDTAFKPDYYERAKKLNISICQVLTLASILEKECTNPDERKIMASVFYNRLSSKDKSLQKLQSTSTLHYIFLSRYGKVKDKFTPQDKEICDSYYNTFTHEGYPPGPICSPSIKSIEAVLYPENTAYLYYKTKSDGSHVFSKTLSKLEES